MKVKNLIENLSKLDQDADILMLNIDEELEETLDEFLVLENHEVKNHELVNKYYTIEKQSIYR